MRILFLGGTGRLSKDAAEYALHQGHEVYLLTRGSADRSLFVNNGYHMLYRDIRDAEGCKELLRDKRFDVVIDFLSYTPDQLKNKLAITEGKYTQYIFISTATVYCKTEKKERIQEDITLAGNTTWDYAYQKYCCEEYLKDFFCKKQDTVFTIVRPYVTYGNTRVPYPIVPFDTQKEWTVIDRIVKGKTIPIFDGGRTHTTLTHTRDFAKGLIGLCGNAAAGREIFHITADETVTWGEVLDSLEEVLGMKVIRKEYSKSYICKMIPEYEGVIFGDKGTDMYFDNAKIKKAVPEFMCVVTLKEGLKEMIDFYHTHEDLRLVDDKWNAVIDGLG